MAEFHILGQIEGASGFKDKDIFCKVRAQRRAVGLELALRVEGHIPLGIGTGHECVSLPQLEQFVHGARVVSYGT